MSVIIRLIMADRGLCLTAVMHTYLTNSPGTSQRRWYRFQSERSYSQLSESSQNKLISYISFLGEKKVKDYTNVSKKCFLSNRCSDGENKRSLFVKIFSNNINILDGCMHSYYNPDMDVHMYA